MRHSAGAYLLKSHGVGRMHRDTGTAHHAALFPFVAVCVRVHAICAHVHHVVFHACITQFTVLCHEVSTLAASALRCPCADANQIFLLQTVSLWLPRAGWKRHRHLGRLILLRAPVEAILKASSTHAAAMIALEEGIAGMMFLTTPCVSCSVTPGILYPFALSTAL